MLYRELNVGQVPNLILDKGKRQGRGATGTLQGENVQSVNHINLAKGVSEEMRLEEGFQAGK